MPITQPSGIPDVVRWWRSTEGLTTDANGKVDGWTDRIVGNVLGNSTAANRPLLAATADAGGYPALNFTGNQVTNMATSSGPVLSQPYSLWAVLMTREGSRLQLVTKTPDVGGVASLEFGVDASASPRWRMFAGGTLAPNVNNAVLGARTALVARFNGNTSQIISNGRRHTVGAAGVRGTGAVLHIGWDPVGSNGNRSWNGHLWELAIFNRLLTDDDVAALDTYAQDRYALSPTVTDYTRPVTVSAPSTAAARTVTAGVRATAVTASSLAAAATTTGGTRTTTVRAAGTAAAQALTATARAASVTAAARAAATTAATTVRTATTTASTTASASAAAAGIRVADVTARAVSAASTTVATTRTAAVTAPALATARATVERVSNVVVTVMAPGLAAAHATTTAVHRAAVAASATGSATTAATTSRAVAVTAAARGAARTVAGRTTSVSVTVRALADALATSARTATTDVTATATGDATAATTTVRALQAVASAVAAALVTIGHYVRPLPPDTGDDIRVTAGHPHRGTHADLAPRAWRGSLHREITAQPPRGHVSHGPPTSAWTFSAPRVRP